MLQIEKGLAEEKEAQAQALAKQVAEATFAQIEANVTSDIKILQSKLPGAAEQAADAALDLKYVRDRQRTLSLQLMRNGKWIALCFSWVLSIKGPRFVY